MVILQKKFHRLDENIDTSVLTLPLHRVSSALPLHFS